MRYICLLSVLFATVASANHNSQPVCSTVYFSGWYCDGSDAVHCRYDSYYGDLYEDAYYNCRSLQNSYGWCSLGSCACYSCAHGTQNRDCSCNCQYPWSGSRCQTCVRSNSECGANGVINRATCKCSCTSGCLNGGVQSDDCSCRCTGPWAGARCDICTKSDAECLNGGYVDRNTCQCVCPQGCQNGGTPDGNCRCSCPSPWQGSLCQVCGLNQANCENGSTLNSNLCQCNCNTACENGGTLSRTCGCNCKYPWTSNLCQTCSIGAGHCKNNANFTAGACACDCSSAISCQNGANRKSDFSCGCECIGGWTGDDCARCGRDSNFCLAGGTLKLSDCQCDCQGIACKNGKLNERCKCLCEAGYSGEDCSKASAAALLNPAIWTVSALVVGASYFLL